MRLVPWAPPAFLEGGGGGQNRAKGAPFDSHEYVVRFQWISTRLGGGGGGGVAVCFRPIQPAGGRGGMLSAIR